MTNPYYAASNTPAAQTRGVSSTIRTEYGLIQTGFDGVNVAILLKGAIAGQVWTGTHDFTGATSVLVPTRTYGTSGQYAVNMDTLNAAVFAAANLPAQTGNSGKFFTTNGTVPSWVSLPVPTFSRSARTANAILVVADKATFIEITSGTFTQTFTAAATLGSGWWCRVKNSGTGDITIPSSDGVTNWVMYPNECRDFFCDGSVFTSSIVFPYRRDFLTSGTWVKPPGYKTHGGLAWSGGNSGQRTNNTGNASVGGAGGGCFPFTLNAADLAATETITVGAGGAAVTTVAGGNVGGNTSFGSWLTVFAGSAYQVGGAIGISNAFQATSTGANGNGFEGANGTPTPGSTVYGGAPASNDATANSGSSIYGGAAGGSVTSVAILRTPGTSKFGGNGGAASSTGNGVDGTAPGGGGGPTQTGTQSGAGARGELRIWGIV